MTHSSPYPALFVDLDIIRSNIRRMNEKAKAADIEFRPHFKTHQSKKIGRIFREFDVSGITVSSLQMAKYFADDGWKDITIAFPVNILAAEEYDALTSEIDLKTLVISKEAVQKLDSQLNNNLGLYIEIDPDYGRSGISISEADKISEVKKAIEASTHCSFAGFYCHAGHTYNARSKEEVKSIAGEALQKLQLLKDEFDAPTICYGDTPSCSVLEDFGPVTQISPGNFVFYDWMQVQIGSCTPEEIAIYMECPVIEKFDQRKQILIHGGAVHFSKEVILSEEKPSFGQLITPNLSPDNYLSTISQEHGIINCAAETYNNLQIGNIVQIYPVHSCLTAGLMRGYFTTNGEKIDHMNGSVL